MAFLEEYTLLDELGQGGFATVYKVRHNKLGYVRAIRVLNAIIAKGEEDATYQKFLQECRLLLRLGNGNHPHIVHIYQPLLKEQRAIVEMDYVDGQDLIHYLVSQGSFVEIEDVMNLLMNISSALAYCHHDIYKFCINPDEDDLKDDPADGSKFLIDDATRQRLLQKYRVIHNDIHSGNIIRREDGTFVLLDFGLAIEGDSVVRSSRRKNGAPEFKAPEKWDNDALLSTQSDIYSFGVVLYEFLTGRVPFQLDKQNSNIVEAEYLLGKAHKEKAPEPIFELRKAAFERKYPGKTYEKDYPDWLEQLIMKCLAKPIGERFADGRELFDFIKSHVSMNLLSASSAEESAAVKALQSENRILMTQLATTQTQLEECKRLLKECENKSIGKADSKELEDLRSKVKNLQAQVEELEKKNALLLKQIEILSEGGGNASNGEIEALREELEATRAELVTLRAEFEAVKDENVALQDKVKSLQSENQQLKSASVPAKGGSALWKVLTVVFFLAAGALGYMYFMMGDKPAPKTEAVDVSAYESEIATLKQQLADKQTQLEAQSSEGDSGLAALLDTKEKEVADLQAQVESLKQQLSQKGGNSAALTAKNKEIEALNEKITNLNAVIDTLKTQISEKDAKIARLEKRIRELEQSIINLSKQYNQ